MCPLNKETNETQEYSPEECLEIRQWIQEQPPYQLEQCLLEIWQCLQEQVTYPQERCLQGVESTQQQGFGSDILEETRGSVSHRDGGLALERPSGPIRVSHSSNALNGGPSNNLGLAEQSSSIDLSCTSQDLI